jgi:hypothetical protein
MGYSGTILFPGHHTGTFGILKYTIATGSAFNTLTNVAFVYKSPWFSPAASLSVAFLLKYVEPQILSTADVADLWVHVTLQASPSYSLVRLFTPSRLCPLLVHFLPTQLCGSMASSKYATVQNQFLRKIHKTGGARSAVMKPIVWKHVRLRACVHNIFKAIFRFFIIINAINM